MFTLHANCNEEEEEVAGNIGNELIVDYWKKLGWNRISCFSEGVDVEDLSKLFKVASLNNIQVHTANTLNFNPIKAHIRKMY